MFAFGWPASYRPSETRLDVFDLPSASNRVSARSRKVGVLCNSQSILLRPSGLARSHSNFREAIRKTLDAFQSEAFHGDLNEV